MASRQNAGIDSPCNRLYRKLRMSSIRLLTKTGRANTAKAAALLVLCILALDLTDAACDPLIISWGTPGLSDVQAGDGDPCGDTCVPDCFCCSSSVPAVHLSLAWEWAPSVVIATLSTPRLSAGFPNFPDHVPITG